MMKPTKLAALVGIGMLLSVTSGAVGPNIARRRRLEYTNQEVEDLLRQLPGPSCGTSRRRLVVTLVDPAHMMDLVPTPQAFLGMPAVVLSHTDGLKIVNVHQIDNDSGMVNVIDDANKTYWINGNDLRGLADRKEICQRAIFLCNMYLSEKQGRTTNIAKLQKIMMGEFDLTPEQEDLADRV